MGYISKTSERSFSSVQSLSCVRLLVTPWIAARQASLSITNSRSLLKLMPIKSVMPSSHLILCRPLLPLSPILPSIRVFSNESTLLMRWPKSLLLNKSIPVLKPTSCSCSPVGSSISLNLKHDTGTGFRLTCDKSAGFPLKQFLLLFGLRGYMILQFLGFVMWNKSSLWCC